MVLAAAEWHREPGPDLYWAALQQICSPVPPPPIGDIDQVELHNEYELFAAVVVNLIATVLKFGDRTQIGAVHLATSLVADLQLIAAAVVWVWASNVSPSGLDSQAMAGVVSLSGGALFANVVSVVLLVVETVSFRRR